MAYQLLDPRDEEELFKTRLLNVEEKPFKRITKRLATLNRVVAAAAAAAGAQEQTPPPDDGQEGEKSHQEKESTAAAAAAASEIAQLREDVTLDFAAFDASIARLQFLAAANARERHRYADHRVTIDDTCQGVRDHMVGLRAQLDTARATLAQRQVFDGLADRITASKTLWPRPEQQATITKLEDECRQLQRESEAYAATWRERKQQFARIMDESMRLRRLIRDEKEEVERREGMDDEETPAGTQTATGTAGTAGTAGTSGATGVAAAAAAGAAGAAVGGSTPASAAGAASGLAAAGVATTNGANSPAPPLETDGDDNGGRTLRPELAAAGAGASVSREATPSAAATATAAASTAATPAPTTSGGGEDGDDVDMVEVDEGDAATATATATATARDGATPSSTPRIVTDGGGGGGGETPAATEQMDTT